VNECDGWFSHRAVYGGGQWLAKQGKRKYMKFTKNNYHGNVAFFGDFKNKFLL